MDSGIWDEMGHFETFPMPPRYSGIGWTFNRQNIIPLYQWTSVGNAGHACLGTQGQLAGCEIMIQKLNVTMHLCVH